MQNDPRLSGYALIHKPKGISSFFALRQAQMRLRDELGGKKVKMGHAGTLDPLAEGLLLCGVGQGTKILSELILSKKSYTAEIFLGKYSETDDEEGEKFFPENPRKSIPDISEIKNLLESHFLGKFLQTPPLYSALKIQGKRACDRARKGNEKGEKEIQEKINKKTREIEVFQIKILEYEFPRLKIFVECGSGTYIRSLARDIGKELSTGGYLTFLRRDSVGKFTLDNAVSLENFSSQDIQKFSSDMFDLPQILVSEDEQYRLEQGQRIRFFEEEEEKKKVLFLSSQSNTVIGFGEADGFVLRPRKIFG